MRNTKRRFTVVAMLLVTCVVHADADAARRNLRTPSKRLIGHWSNKDTELFVGPRDAHSGLGPIAWVVADGTVVQNKYKIVSEEPRGEGLTIRIASSDGGAQIEGCVVTRDGRSLTTRAISINGKFLPVGVAFTYSYIDSKTTPPR